jgi:hypothetical protein
MAETQQQQQQQQVQTVKVTVRQQGRQEQRELFETPVETPVVSSFVETMLERVYGPGVLRLESSNAVLAPTRALQPAEGYVYVVSAGVCGPPVAPGHRVSVLQAPNQPTVHRQPCVAAQCDTSCGPCADA